MSRLLRHFQPGDICFITTTTFERLPLLVENFPLVRRAYQRTRCKFDFQLIAWVVLPDHIHAVIDCPGADYSKVLQSFKKSFSLQFRHKVNSSGPFWQRRFWDHIIRDEQDLRHHLDYIHINAVKHRLAAKCAEWTLSSFGSFRKRNFYEADRGVNVEFGGDREFGE